ncbi:MAG: DeoR/GlpR transcriptional regulator [Chloroflexi bacterium]|nr:DeoR/GlpR transcriptional regulator [Chloroflexota bacterium]
MDEQSLLKDERQQFILEELRGQRRVWVSDLSGRLGVSDATIRRDLRELEEAGQLRRAHGGAILVEPTRPELPVVRRMDEHRYLKELIGRATASLVKDGETVFISSGSSAAYVARHLVERTGLTVVTNAVNILDTFLSVDNVTVVMTGGMLRPSELSLIGHITESALREVRVDKVIFGVRAISAANGITNDYLPEVMTDRAIIQMAPELIIPADHTKLGKTCSAFVAPIECVATIVTDSGADPGIVDGIRARGIRVIVVEDDGVSGIRTLCLDKLSAN